MDELKSTMFELVEREQPMTVRQVFYRMTTVGAIPKTEQGYKTVGRILVQMRRNREIPFNWLADNTRWMRKPNTFDDLDDALRQTAAFYRRAIWQDQEDYVEVWLEKEALAGVVVDVTAEWDVPLMVTRGYPSLSFVHSAAKTIEEIGKPTFIYYFGDLDPSGMDIPRRIEADLRDFAPWAEINFERVAVTREQVVLMDLPGRPTKFTDTRSRSFDGESVELDAIPPVTLRELVRVCIEDHVDGAALEATQAAEQSEREVLAKIAATARGEA